MKDFAKGLAITQLIPKNRLGELIKKWDLDKGVTKLPTEKLLDVLIRSFVFQKQTLRDISDSYGVPKSTLDDALRKRSSGFFEELCSVALEELIPLVEDRKQRQEIRELIAIDSSICLVHGSMAEQFISTKIEKKVAGIKFHVAWNSTHEWIEEFRVTGYRKNDGAIGEKLSFSEGKTYVFDRAYIDFSLWMKIREAKSHFVTRLKKIGHRLKHTHEFHQIQSTDVGVLFDGKWTPSEAACARARVKVKTIYMRHVIYRDPNSKRLFDFVTSDFESPALEIAQIYRKRWSVELLFRWLKGHFNIRRISFKNFNAIRLQISVLVLVQLLLKCQMLKENFVGTSWEYLRSQRNYLDRAFYQISLNQGFQPGRLFEPLPCQELT